MHTNSKPRSKNELSMRWLNASETGDAAVKASATLETPPEHFHHWGTRLPSHHFALSPAKQRAVVSSASPLRPLEKSTVSPTCARSRTDFDRKNTPSHLIDENGHVHKHHPFTGDRKITVAINIDLLIGKERTQNAKGPNLACRWCLPPMSSKTKLFLGPQRAQFYMTSCSCVFSLSKHACTERFFSS